MYRWDQNRGVIPLLLTGKLPPPVIHVTQIVVFSKKKISLRGNERDGKYMLDIQAEVVIYDTLLLW